MNAPAIKGTAIASVIEDVRQLRDGGRISAEELEARLEREDLRCLEEKVLPGGWYPLDSYARLTELLQEIEGGGSASYIVLRGEAAARRLFDAGLYRQLTGGEERAEALRQRGEEWDTQDGSRIASLAGAIFNVSRWQFEVDADDRSVYRIRVSEAEALPEVARLAAQGFIQYTASRLGANTSRVSSQRTDRDQIVFTIRTPGR